MAIVNIAANVGTASIITTDKLQQKDADVSPKCLTKISLRLSYRDGVGCDRSNEIVNVDPSA